MTTAMLLLRIHRRSITGVALLLVVLSALQASGYAAVAGDTPEERAAFAAQSEGLSFTAMSAMVWLADARGIDFALDRTVLAAVLLVPFTVAVGAVGALWTSWRPAGAVAGLTGATVAGCFIQEVTPLYGWPDWLMNVFAFRLYGNPLVGAVDPEKVTAMSVVGLVGFIGASLLMRVRDVGS